ncbi:MAG: hypothetical protein KDI36_07370 [Pseudomonadales bacterium]|nr:hypothetical protein [Pseudomonadales bacterium]
MTTPLNLKTPVNVDFAAARHLIMEQGTNLQREMFSYRFESGSRRNVICALSHYQNQDGGFGHGLEPDLRTRHSSVLATTVALQILQEMNALKTPLALGALSWLNSQFNGQGWSLVTSTHNDAPHAPWWSAADDTAEPRFSPNADAEILACLFAANAMATERPQLVRAAVDSLQRPPEMHELLCFLRLYNTKATPVDLKQAILPVLLTSSRQLVKTTVSGWEEYGLQPADLVTDQCSPLFALFQEVLADNLHFRASRQEADGGWSPAWSWGTDYPHVWQQILPEIRAAETLRHLTCFQRFNLLPSAG